MKLVMIALGLAGLAGCATDTGSGVPSGGVVAEALTSTSDGASGIAFVMLEGHVACPTIGALRDGRAFDVRGRLIGAAMIVNLRDGLTDAGGGSHQISEDAFFNDVSVGPFTICAHPLDDAGACLGGCDTATAFGNATPAHKAHVTLIMTCNTPPTQDVGAVVEIQNTPIVNLTAANETGLVGCGTSTTGDILSIGGKIVSPDHTAGEYLVSVLGHPESVIATPAADAWFPAAAGFMVNFENTSGDTLSVPIVIRGRTPALDGGFLYAPDYTLTLQWLACE